MDEFKLIVAGGRNFQDYQRLCSALDALRFLTLPDKTVSIVCGKARGAVHVSATQHQKAGAMPAFLFYAIALAGA